MHQFQNLGKLGAVPMATISDSRYSKLIHSGKLIFPCFNSSLSLILKWVGSVLIFKRSSKQFQWVIANIIKEFSNFALLARGLSNNNLYVERRLRVLLVLGLTWGMRRECVIATRLIILLSLRGMRFAFRWDSSVQ